MIEKANEYLVKMKEKQAKWQEKNDERAERLKEKVAEHVRNREMILNKIESLIKPEEIKRISDLREEGLTKEKEIIGALENKNLSEKIKQKLEELQKRIEAHRTEIKQFNETKKELLEKVQTGDEKAREELKQFMESKRQEKQERWEKKLEANGAKKTN